MSSDEAEKKNVEEEPSKEASSSEGETEKKEEEKPKEDKVNNKAGTKKKDPPKIKQPAKKRVKSEQAEKETKKEDKKENKKKVEEKEVVEEEDEESGDENEVNHKVVPLLDQPLEISGKRKTKEVQRFTPKPEEEISNKEVRIPEGKGKALGEIERIQFNIQRAKPEDLKLLHRLCFGKLGKAATVKKVLRQFNGFEFVVDSAEFKTKKEFVDKSFKKVTVAHLKNICNILDIERGGTKEDLIDRILKFITCPIDSGKKLPGGGRSKRKGVSNKNYEEGEESHKSRKRSKTKKKAAESEESENEKEDEDEKDEKDEKEEDVEEKDVEKKKENATTKESEEKIEEEEVVPKKGTKRGKKAADAADKKAPPKKRAAAKKVVEKSDSEADADGENESEDDEPLAKKNKVPPTDEEIKTYVKSLLEGANLELITMKKVCQDVYAHYPDFDLAHKKDFIKSTVKNLISS